LNAKGRENHDIHFFLSSLFGWYMLGRSASLSQPWCGTHKTYICCKKKIKINLH